MVVQKDSGTHLAVGHQRTSNAQAVYVPSKRREVGTSRCDVPGGKAAGSERPEYGRGRPSGPSLPATQRQYQYGHKVRLAQGTDSLRLLRAFAAGAMYYDPGIKLECLRTATSVHRAGEVQEAKPVSRGIEEHHRALRDGGDGGGMTGARLGEPQPVGATSRRGERLAGTLAPPTWGSAAGFFVSRDCGRGRSATAPAVEEAAAAK